MKRKNKKNTKRKKTPKTKTTKGGPIVEPLPRRWVWKHALIFIRI